MKGLGPETTCIAQRLLVRRVVGVGERVLALGQFLVSTCFAHTLFFISLFVFRQRVGEEVYGIRCFTVVVVVRRERVVVAEVA